VESSGGGPPRGGIPQGKYSMTKTGLEFRILVIVIYLIFMICDLDFLILQYSSTPKQFPIFTGKAFVT
jgi:uncharacterized membrane protein